MSYTQGAKINFTKLTHIAIILSSSLLNDCSRFLTSPRLSILSCPILDPNGYALTSVRLLCTISFSRSVGHITNIFLLLGRRNLYSSDFYSLASPAWEALTGVGAPYHSFQGH